MREGEVPEYKKKKVEEVKQFMLSKPVVGIISIENLPTAQFQQIKKKLRGKADVMVTKLNYIRRALEQIPDLKQLEEYAQGPVGVIISDENPFKLFNFLKKNRSKAYAKAGMIAEQDIIVPAGETDIPVGPTLSELKMAKIDCRIDKGKIVVSKDSVVAKAGEEITPTVASALAKLDIKPFEIGLKLKAVYEDGVIYTPDVLDIDEEETMNNLQNAVRKALNLAVNAGYPTKQSITFMIQEAFRKALNLSVNAGIYNKKSIELLLQKAAVQANALKSINA